MPNISVAETDSIICGDILSTYKENMISVSSSMVLACQALNFKIALAN